MTDTSDTPPDSISGDVIGASDTSGEWLPPSAAAIRLGISERTLWRHVGAGRYHKRIVSGRSEVLVPESGSVTDNSARAVELALPDDDRQMSLAVIEELRRQHDVAEERLTRQTDRIAALERENGKLTAERDAVRADLAREQAKSWWDRLLGRT